LSRPSAGLVNEACLTISHDAVADALASIARDLAYDNFKTGVDRFAN